MIIASIASPDPCDPNLMNIKYVQWLLFWDEARLLRPVRSTDLLSFSYSGGHVLFKS